jgi:DNA polymerase II small subunit/DNA polymerase delta subunit B
MLKLLKLIIEWLFIFICPDHHDIACQAESNDELRQRFMSRYELKHFGRVLTDEERIKNARKERGA